jgi:hypothetical protein
LSSDSSFSKKCCAQNDRLPSIFEGYKKLLIIISPPHYTSKSILPKLSGEPKLPDPKYGKVTGNSEPVSVANFVGVKWEL